MSSLVNNILFVIFSFSLLCFSHIYVWSSFFGEKINYKNKNLYFGFIIMFCLGLINYFCVSAFVRMILDVPIFCICNYVIFHRKFNEAVVSTTFTEFILTLTDVVCALVVMVFFNINTDSINNSIFLSSCGNLLTTFLFVFVCKLLIVKKFYFKLVNLIERINIKQLIFICMFVMITFNFLMASIYFKLNSVIIILINAFMILIYSIIMYRSLNEKSKNLLMKSENKSLMRSLNQYEDMVDRQRVDNHENKNQLLIIKNMIKKNDKDVVKYIDTIVKDQKEDDEALYTRVMTIPSGGLQGIIYQKMLVMKDEKILFSLDVSRDVRKIELDDFSMEDNYRLCKIVGVLLDNAIEESRKIDDKRIMISLYVDNNKLVIDISNRFEGKVEVDKLDDEGYTTKGDGHGYGLSLVKKILSESDIFENERSVRRDVFKQVVRVKIKNT